MTGDDIWLDEGQQKDWRASVVGMTYLLGAFSRDLEVSTGLSMPEYEILVRLSEAPGGSVRMSELAEQVAHSRSRVTHTVTRLEAAGLVQRRPTEQDKRGIAAIMTPEGRERLVSAAPFHVQSVRARLVDVIPREDLAALGAAMRGVLLAAGLDDTLLGPHTPENLRD